jgi:hypothetical protein
MIGVRRKRDWADLDISERDREKDTVTLHVVKNKRPPGRLTPRDGIDFLMEPNTGVIRPMADGEGTKRAIADFLGGSPDPTDAVRQAAA